MSFTNRFLIICIFLFYLFIHLHPLSADVLIPGTKPIFGHIKFEGWDTMKDYVVVIPRSTQWDYCDEKITFFLVNDGEVFKFGAGAHRSDYFYPVAIDRKYISDIIFLERQSEEEGGLEVYAVNCDSEAYRTAYKTDVVIPHEYETAPQTEEYNGKDYIVTFTGVDNDSRKFSMSVSDPILRYGFASPESIAFEESLTKSNILTGIPLAVAVSPTIPTPTVTVSNPTVTPTQETHSSTSGTFWKFISYLSVAAAAFLIGIIIGRRKKPIYVQ